MNKFADLTSADFAKYMGFKKHAPKVHDTSKFLARTESNPITAGARKDWREAGVVSDIKDQGQCGSCWAFSAVSAFETSYAISTGNLIHLSEQEVVDCDIYGQDMGCNGGFMDQAMEFIISNGGLTTTRDYPYTAQARLLFCSFPLCFSPSLPGRHLRHRRLRQRRRLHERLRERARLRRGRDG